MLTPKQPFRVAPLVPFRIIALRRVAFGSKTAEFAIETPIGVVDCDLFTPQGREPFVTPRSIRDKFTGGWRRTVTLDRTLAARVLDALHTQPPQPKEKHAERQPQRDEPNAALVEGEQRFDDAFADIDGAEAQHDNA